MQCISLQPCSVKPEILKRVGEAMTTLPENFKPHRAVKKIFDLRRQMIETGEGIDWAVGEALAFATLIVEGNHVRLSGQDVERGTFSHRHSVIHDQETGERYCPLDNLVMNQDEELFTVSNRYEFRCTKLFQLGCMYGSMELVLDSKGNMNIIITG
jgi:2-oxoglutarate dehydrogenase E1 component